MKKGVFSVMHYLMPERGVLTLHSGCNVGAAGDVTLFFGLSGTGARNLHHAARCCVAALFVGQDNSKGVIRVVGVVWA